MLARRDLERIAETLSHGNVGHAQTLYLQDMVLGTVGRETTDDLVFKGGTALRKFYQLDRFSEDLDFTQRGGCDVPAVIETAERDLENYGAVVEETTVDMEGPSVNARLGIRGPLYTGDRRSLCFLRVEVNQESSVQRPSPRRYTPPFRDLPSFELTVLAEEEILAEKLRAIMTRRQPRDLYDVYHLLEKSVTIDRALVSAKLEYYDLAYDPDAIVDRARAFERSWDSLSALTYADPPPLASVVERLEANLPRRE